ncbi:hypothetical protein [Neptuniibacter sp. QD48_11]|uniref:hypothetical protein n=1 Tax=Neptuniibacter sp. QD48_11 TaxID=3398211 RepID=UPI0039F5789E
MAVKLESTLVGVAEEYLVAGELSLRGYIASITLRNSRGIDIIASSADGDNSVSVQVKTNSDGGSTWMLNSKAEHYCSDNHYYVFVSLNDLGKRPNFHIVPSEYVAQYVRESHASWLAGKKKDGTSRKDTNMRKFKDHTNEFLEAWHHINLKDRF